MAKGPYRTRQEALRAEIHALSEEIGSILDRVAELKVKMASAVDAREQEEAAAAIADQQRAQMNMEILRDHLQFALACARAAKARK
jgi:Arc/MetJ-type ribon-helix-helix transcriptional regulator